MADAAAAQQPDFQIYRPRTVSLAPAEPRAPRPAPPDAVHAFTATSDVAPPALEPPAMAPAVLFRSGCHIGVHGGGVLSMMTIKSSDEALRAFPGQSASPQGAIAGFQGGCDMRSGDMLVGLEGEWSSPASAKGSSLRFRNDFQPLKNRYDMKERPFFTLSARGGYVNGAVLVFAKVGMIHAHTKLRSDFESATLNGANVGQDWFSTYDAYRAKANSGQFGLLLGVGVEYAVTSRFSVKAEYDLAMTSDDAKFLQDGVGRSYTRDAGGAIVETETSGINRIKTVSAFRNILKVGVNFRY
jgi:opacity protein-like surface antigen